MAFTTLEERFNQSARDIYNRFSNATLGNAEIKPDSTASKSNIKNDSRLLPVVSVLRDTSRVSKFLQSEKGKLFLAKQTLLQTGNVFAETRFYNPLETLLNVPPSPRISRAISTFGKLRKDRGSLQIDTIKALTPTSDIPATGLRDRLNQAGRAILNSSAVNAITSPIRALTASPEFVTGSSGKFFKRPEDVRGAPNLPAKQDISDMGNKRSYGQYTSSSFFSNIATFYNQEDPVTGLPFGELQGNSAATNSSRILFPRSYLSDTNTDFYNRTIVSQSTGLYTNQITYNSITGIDEQPPDIVKFIFYDAKGENPVRFRAFISSIKEQVKPEFNEQRYVGRIERFVTYGGVKRTVSLEFNIVAMGPSELDAMWLRINNLTGRAFPSSISTSGFLAPPLFKLTVGNIYNLQPCYIDNLDYDFLDDSITFDKDREVSKVINVRLSLTLLEKRTKVYDSPFYTITEAMQGKATRLPTVSTQLPTTGGTAGADRSAQSGGTAAPTGARAPSTGGSTSPSRPAPGRSAPATGGSAGTAPAASAEERNRAARRPSATATPSVGNDSTEFRPFSRNAALDAALSQQPVQTIRAQDPRGSLTTNGRFIWLTKLRQAR